MTFTDNNIKAINWAKTYISQEIKTTIADERIVVNTPWSFTYQIDTNKGRYFLKQTPKILATEAHILKILGGEFSAPVPQLIHNNDALCCFLMHDCGQNLRVKMKHLFQPELLYQAVNLFAKLQVLLSNKLDSFFNVGVPDWRLDKLPQLFAELIAKYDYLIAYGLSPLDIDQLSRLTPHIKLLSEKLTTFDIPSSIVQPDFHDNNILIDKNNKIIFIDVGEIVIAHPFMSLITSLQQIKKHHAKYYSAMIEQAIINSYYSAYLPSHKQSELEEAFRLASQLHLIYAALFSDRLMMACGAEQLEKFQPNKFLQAMKTCLQLQGAVS